MNCIYKRTYIGFQLSNNFYQQARMQMTKSVKKNISVLTKVNGLLQEIQKYRSIGTIKECREARNSRIKKKPITYTETNRADCPVCGAAVRGIGKPFGGFCAGCGQGIDWGDIE